MTQLARRLDETEGSWFGENVSPILRALWRPQGDNWFIAIQTEKGPILGFVGEVRTGVLGWQIEFNDGIREERLGDFSEDSLPSVKAMVERGVLELVASRGGKWSRIVV